MIKKNLREGESDWWDELPESVKKSIDIALEQVEEDETIPNKVVFQEMKAKY